MSSRQSNKNKEIINKSLIVSYFLIFALVLMLLFVTKTIFFGYNATETVSYNDYTGSIHIGVDTTAGDYYIQNNSNSTAALKYGMRTDENQPFTVIPYTDNQIIRVHDGEHIIVYEANFIPVQTVEEMESTASEQTAALATVTEGMIKFSPQSYNVPYVLAPQGEDPYYELYDSELNVIAREQLDGETLVAITPEQATYIRFNDVEVSNLANYKTSGRLEGTYFSPAVYVVGQSLESGTFELQPTADNCRYRVIEDSETVAKTAFNDCSKLPLILELSDGQILEVHGANIYKYYPST